MKSNNCITAKIMQFIHIFVMLCGILIILFVCSEVNNNFRNMVADKKVSDEQISSVFYTNAIFDSKLCSKNSIYLKCMKYLHPQIYLSRYTREIFGIGEVKLSLIGIISISLKYSRKEHEKLKQSSCIALVRPWLQSYTAGNLAKHQSFEDTQPDGLDHSILAMKYYNRKF